MRYIILGRFLSLRVSAPVCRLFKKLSKREIPVGPVEMWESRAAFWRDFSKRRWKSASFADFHGRGISIRPFVAPSLPTNFTEDPINDS
jgi:hypothetical protein